MCKKLLCLVTLVLVLGLAVPASATYYLAGDWNAWDNTADPMTDGGAGVHSATLTLDPDARYEFKIYDDIMETWYPVSNSWLFTKPSPGDGVVTVTYNTNVVSDGWLPAQDRIGLSTDPGSWTIAGSFSGAGYPDWDPSGAGMQMAHLGSGFYKLTLNLPTGGGPDWIGDPELNTYAWKAVVTGSWDSISVDGRSVNTANAMVTVSPGFEVVNFYVDSYTGVVLTEVIPEPATIALLGLGGLALFRRKR